MDPAPEDSTISAKEAFHHKCEEKFPNNAGSSLRELESEIYNNEEKRLEGGAENGNVVKGLSFIATPNLDPSHRNARLMPNYAVTNTGSKKGRVKDHSKEEVLKNNSKQCLVKKAFKNDEAKMTSKEDEDKKGPNGDVVMNVSKNGFVKKLEVEKEKIPNVYAAENVSKERVVKKVRWADEVNVSSEATVRKCSNGNVFKPIPKESCLKKVQRKYEGKGSSVALVLKGPNENGVKNIPKESYLEKLQSNGEVKGSSEAGVKKSPSENVVKIVPKESYLQKLWREREVKGSSEAGVRKGPNETVAENVSQEGFIKEDRRKDEVKGSSEAGVKKDLKENVIKNVSQESFIEEDCREDNVRDSSEAGVKKDLNENVAENFSQESFIEEDRREDEVIPWSEVRVRSGPNENVVMQIKKLFHSYDCGRFRDNTMLGKRFEKFLNEGDRVEGSLKTLDEEICNYEKRFLQQYGEILKVLNSSTVQSPNRSKQNEDLPQKTTTNGTMFSWVFSNNSLSTSQSSASKVAINESNTSEVKIVSKEAVPKDAIKICGTAVTKSPVEEVIKRTPDAVVVNNSSIKDMASDASKIKMLIKRTKQDMLSETPKDALVEQFPNNYVKNEESPSTKKMRYNDKQ